MLEESLMRKDISSAKVRLVVPSFLYAVVSAFARLFARISRRFISFTIPVWAVYNPFTIYDTSIFTVLIYIGQCPHELYRHAIKSAHKRALYALILVSFSCKEFYIFSGSDCYTGHRMLCRHRVDSGTFFNQFLQTAK